ncbi:MAG TPA: tetratricopeptide repeat protein [Polyangiaceae bacterium]|nr:tetratricopeptide repeat protein [Polyangiaceae bacterium]
MRIVRAVPLALASALAASSAGAQSETQQSPQQTAQPQTPPRRHRQGGSQTAPTSGPSNGAPPVIVRREVLAAKGFVKAARDRMSSGDCAGALDAFDQALEEQRSDPSLYRDRGTCHDRLGHPYPAIEDYRMYLTLAPDATDAAAVRSRLHELQDQVAGRVPSSAPEGSNASGGPGGSEGSSGTGPSNDSDGSGGPRASGDPAASGAPQHPVDDDVPPKENALTGLVEPGDGPEAGPQPDKASRRTEDEDVPRSSLRADRGWALAPFIAARKWFRDGESFGDGETWAECVGGQLRYSMGSRGALLLEVGYERFDTTNVDVETVSGLTSLLELELRFPFNARYDDQMLVSPGFGYEYLAYSPGADSSFSKYTEGGVTARLRVSYRHMLAESVAFDVSVEGGFAQFSHLSNAAADTHAAPAGLAGLTVAFLWGL